MGLMELLPCGTAPPVSCVLLWVGITRFTVTCHLACTLANPGRAAIVVHPVNQESTLYAFGLQAPAGSLKRVYTTLDTTDGEAPTVSLFSMLLMLGRLAPTVGLSAIDADDFRGLPVEYLEGDNPGDE